MKNLEDVVKERNRAYWLLETGEDGERPGAVVTDEIGEWFVGNHVFCSCIPEQQP